MNVALFDHPQIRQQLLPFTYTRPVAEIRTGILTITEKWQSYLGEEVNHLTQDYLANKFPGPANHSELLVINGGICPDADFVTAINVLGKDQGLSQDGVLLAAYISEYKSWWNSRI